MATTFPEGKCYESLPDELLEPFLSRMIPVHIIRFIYKQSSKKTDKELCAVGEGKGMLGAEKRRDGEIYATGFCVNENGMIWTSQFFFKQVPDEILVLYSDGWKTMAKTYENGKFMVCALERKESKEGGSFQYAKVGDLPHHKISQRVQAIYGKHSLAIGTMTYRNFGSASGGFRHREDQGSFEGKEFYEVTFGIKDFSLLGAPIFNAGGEVIGILASFVDNVARVKKLCSPEYMKTTSSSSSSKG